MSKLRFKILTLIFLFGTLLIIYNQSLSHLNKSLKEQDSSKLFCMIIATENVLNTHDLKMYKLWVNECDDHVFVSMIPKKYHSSSNKRPILIEDKFKVLQPPGFESDSYKNLTHKVYLSFKHLYKTEKSPFDWYLKADIDTFVFIDNLREFVKARHISQPVTYGFNYKQRVPKGYQSGGAGINIFISILLRYEDSIYCLVLQVTC